AIPWETTSQGFASLTKAKHNQSADTILRVYQHVLNNYHRIHSSLHQAVRLARVHHVYDREPTSHFNVEFTFPTTATDFTRTSQVQRAFDVRPFHGPTQRAPPSCI
ncbi:MAG: hypothetical protein ACREBR_03085, partial [bacterium]